ncbi:MAG: hypothetical protein HYR97_03090, partial [Candidatus Melainabacteria bacterium]|nr:hypothetical protein [Candidatus Melainabacteria bacterium]
MVNATELLPESRATTYFDSSTCQLTLGIPRGEDGLAVKNIDIANNDELLSMGFCNQSTATLMVLSNNLPAGSTASVFFDPVQCNLTLGIPVGFNGINGESGSNGMGLCNDRNAIPTTKTVTLSANSAATIDLDPATCTITHGIPKGETGSQGESGSHCWDLNSNKACNLSSEDKNGDGQCNPFDCQGATGEGGVNCWDLNENGRKDPTEDTNGDGHIDVLDCLGGTGATGLTTLVNITTELAGSNCTAGGKKVQSGFDTNNSGVLDSSEISQVDYVCNGIVGATGAVGAVGTTGLISLVNITTELVSSNCSTGGKKIQTGIDLNNNGALDSSEVSQTDFVCNGVAGVTGATGTTGLTSLVSTTVELAGSNCTAGGQKIQTGLDANNNGVLDSSEISQTNYVCNGLEGVTGITGLNSLVSTTIELAGSNCTAGGTKVQSGLDANNNGVLNSSEISQTDYICNGIAGAAGASGSTTLVSTAIELAGSNCITGGQKLQSGLDVNTNGLLDSSEVTQTDYICNGLTGLAGTAGTAGTTGLTSLVSAIDEPASSNCAAGGKKIQSGLDANNNGLLDSLEVSETNYVCNGLAGAIGATGLAAVNCWDLNGDRVNDSNEDINMDGLFNIYDCNGPEIKFLEELIVGWINDSAEQNFTTASGDMTRMIKIPYFTHDGVIYGGFWIDKYEASRSNASSIAEGTSSIPTSKRNVVPWANLTLAQAKAQASVSGRQISGLGSCKLVGMREWYALYLLGRYMKENGVLGTVITSGWNERGNTRSGKDGRANLLFTCTDDPTESGAITGRCLTGTGYKSWGHFLDSLALSNIQLGTSPGFGIFTGTADTVKDDGNGSGSDTFDGDFQIYDLVGNVNEWIDFTVTKT